MCRAAMEVKIIKRALIFQFAVLVSTHLTQRCERDCTTIGAFYNVAS
jgi:hypothetical protein